MPTAPNTDNYTVPGGIKLFLNTGTGERDLGNIVEIDLEPGQDLLEHYTNRSGKRMKDKQIVLEDKLTINFTMDEPNLENMRLYFRGGTPSSEGGGTGTITDQTLTLNGTAYVSVGGYYGLSAVTVRQYVDYCFMYSGTAFTDYSAEADTLAGVAFTTITDADDMLYIGKTSKFKELYFDFATPGSYGAVLVKYWNGATWGTVSDLTGAAAALAADGKMGFTEPVDWATKEVNGVTGYFLQISATTPWTTPATVNCIRQNAVANTDYILDPGSAEEGNRQDGRIARIAGGFLGATEKVKVTFSYTTWASMKMAIAAVGNIEGSVRLECFPTTGRGIKWEAYFGKASIMAKGAMKLDDKTWLPVPMTIEVLDNTNADPTYPFGWYRSYEEAV